MPRMPISSLSDLVGKILELRGICGDAHKLIRDDLLQAELQGKRSHGLGKLLLLDTALQRRQGDPRVISKSSAICVIDGSFNLGHVVGQLAAENGIDIARKTGISLVSFNHFSRYSRLSAIVNRPVQQGMVCLLMNTGGPPAVVPHGSRDPILGTNPLAFGFPLKPRPLIIDFSTSKSPWGEIRQALLENRSLPDGTFLDKNGDITVDASNAEAVLPFGDHKGAALCLAIEVMVGLLTRSKLGTEVNSEYDLGAILVTIDPEFLGVEDSDMASVARLLREIRASRPRISTVPVRVPGDQSAEREENARRTGFIEVDEKTHALLAEMSHRVGVGLEDSTKTN